MTMVKKFRIAGLMVVAAVLYCSLVTPVSAQLPCPGSEPFGDLAGGAISGCFDGDQVFGYAYAPGVSADNTCPAGLTRCTAGTLDNIICESASEPNPQGTPVTGCDPQAGTNTDGLVTINGNWGNVGVSGCPNPNGVFGVGRNVYVVRDSRGAGIIISVGYDQAAGAYVAEYAGAPDLTPLPCVAQPSSVRRSLAWRLNNLTTTATNATADVTVITPALGDPTSPTPQPGKELQVFTDCHPNSAGIAFNIGSCTEGPSGVPLAPGKLYTMTGACPTTTSPLPSRIASRTTWTLTSPQPDATGHAVLTLPKPASPDCVFLGATFLINGVESLGIEGPLAIAGQNAAADRAVDVRATQGGGKITVSYRTEAELLVAGFNIYSETGKGPKQVNSSLIAAKGVGGAGAFYEVPLNRGLFQNGRSLYVESVLANGTTIKSASAKF